MAQNRATHSGVAHVVEFTKTQRLVLSKLLNGRKRWKDILKETRVSDQGLASVLEKLIEKKVVKRHQEETGYPPPVYYEIDIKRLDEVREEIRKDPTIRKDLYNSLQTVMEKVLKETDLQTKLHMLTAIFGQWAAHQIQSITDEVLLGIICATYGDWKTCQTILNHAKRNFANTANYLVEQASEEPLILVSILRRVVSWTAEDFAEIFAEVSDNYSQYPGRGWMLEQITLTPSPTIADLKKSAHDDFDYFARIKRENLQIEQYPDYVAFKMENLEEILEKIKLEKIRLARQSR